MKASAGACFTWPYRNKTTASLHLTSIRYFTLNNYQSWLMKVIAAGY